MLDGFIDGIHHLHCHLVVHKLSAEIVIYDFHVFLFHWFQ